MTVEHGLNAGFKWFFLIFGGLTSILLIGIPVFILGFKAKATVTEEALEWWWLSHSRVPWEDIKELRRATGGGLIGGLMRPMSVVHRDGKVSNFPVGCFARSHELRAQISARSGHKVP